MNFYRRSTSLKLIRSIVLVLAPILTAQFATGQAFPTASRLADVQVGATFSNAAPNYAQNPYNLSEPTTGRWHGYGAYADIDFHYHLGMELNFHDLAGSNPILYERTYQAGLRYLYPVHNRFVPYAKAMVGRGVFNFAAQNAAGQSEQIANLGYNTTSFGGGLDLRVLPGLNIRVIDYEYQRWANFPPRGLNPQVLSFGVAYHFHGSIISHK